MVTNRLVCELLASRPTNAQIGGKPFRSQARLTAASSISRWSGERIGVFGAFAAGRVRHRNQKPWDRRGRHHAPHPAQERPDHAPLRPNLRPVDPQRHHRREPLIAVRTGAGPAAQFLCGQTMPAANPTRSRRTRRTTPTDRRHTDATRRSGGVSTSWVCSPVSVAE